jgi:hypothetical protein
VHPGWAVYTLDNKHSGQDALVERGRHCCANFADYRRMKQSLRQDLDTSGPFNTIILDYAYSPAGHVEARWSQRFFTITLPGLAEDGLLADGGTIWLPATDYVGEQLRTHAAILSHYYSVTRTPDVASCRLVPADQAVQHEVAQERDFNNEPVPETLYCLTRCKPDGCPAAPHRTQTTRCEPPRLKRPRPAERNSDHDSKRSKRDDPRPTGLERYFIPRRDALPESHADTANYHGTPPAGIG